MRHSIYGILFERALELEGRADYMGALALLYQARRWSDTDADWWERLGLLSACIAEPAWLLERGLEDGYEGDRAATNAEVYLQRATELAPNEPRHWFWLGWVRQALYGNRTGAHDALERALALAPRHPYALATLARLALAAEPAADPAGPIAALVSATARLPESARLHYDLGVWHCRAQDEAAARASFAAAVRCPALAPGPAAGSRLLAREFHADGPQVQALIASYYPQLAPGAHGEF